MSPTDERHTDARRFSPDTSYEDDIEANANANAINSNSSIDQEPSNKSVRPSVRKSLMNIFSPASRTSNANGKEKESSTPETDTGSPQRGGRGYSARQLFSPGQYSTSTDGYEGDDSEFGLKNGKRGKCWAYTICLVALVLGTAIALIAYFMVVENRNAENNASSITGFDLDIAQGANSNTNNGNADFSEDVTVIGVADKDDTGNSTQGEFTFDFSDLRPVTSRRDPTPRPTPSPTASPTTKAPTKAPTNKPTNEGDFVGRLQELLQARNYQRPDGQPFYFDFSTNEALEEPANKALVYLAREVAAVMGVSKEDLESPYRGNSDPALGNVVVTQGDETIPPTVVDPDFNPILIRDYDDDKLVQRFALLSLQFEATSSGATSAFADKQEQPILADDTKIVAEPMKRIVWKPEELEQAQSPPTEAPFDPTSLADPTDIRFLVDECYWDGVECAPIDNSTDTATIVTKIRWDYMDLDGQISPALSLLKDLVYLDMSNNNLNGPIPESLYQLTNLEEIYLYKNGLSGSLSTSIGNLDKLRRLHLSHNSLTGTLPTQLKSDAGSENGIRPIQYFNIYSNQFTGSIPNDLRWRQCLHFDVGRNQLTGRLPEDLGEKFVELRQLYLDHNAFTGGLPESYNTVGNGRLVSLALEHNQLTGVVPGLREHYDTLVQYTLQENNFTRLEQQNCNNVYLVEFKADCPNVCTCYGGFFQFCDRWCGSNRPEQQQQQQRPQQTQQRPQQQWQQQPPRNWSF